MKIGLLADIHGNSYALRAVLDAAVDTGVERLLIAGDLVGYYYDADVVLDLLSAWPCTVVRGNHEELLSMWIRGEDREEIRAKYGSAFEEVCARLQQEQLQWLTSLPHPQVEVIAGRSVLLCHGTPLSLTRYAYPDASSKLRRDFLMSGHDIVVFGHTHYPVVWSEGPVRAVNPGSVGQPRDGNPAAAWMVWDTSTDAVTLVRTPYDSMPLRAECRWRDPEVPYLVDVLTRGKTR